MSHPSRKRALLAALSATVLIAGGASPSLANAPSKDGGGKSLSAKHQKMQHDIKAAQADLDESSHAAYVAGKALLSARAELSSAQAQLDHTQSQLKKAKHELKRLRKALVKAKAKLAKAQAELDAARHKAIEQRAALGRVAADTVQGPDPHLMGLVALMNDDDPANLSTQFQTVGNVLDRQDQVLARYRAAKTRLQVQERKVQAATDAVSAQRTAAARTVVRKKSLVKDAKQQRSKVARLVSARATAQAAADKARDSDRAELGKLKKEDARIQALIARKAGHGSYGNGTLLRPVTGYVTSPFGYRIHPIYGYYALHDGTDFHAPCGTPLRAAGNGRVISEYFQTAWGNRLLLDLGEVGGHQITVIYNHLSAYRVHTGATVTRGETVGYAGTTGWSTGCHLHFTVMVDGVPKDPMTFF